MRNSSQGLESSLVVQSDELSHPLLVLLLLAELLSPSVGTGRSQPLMRIPIYACRFTTSTLLLMLPMMITATRNLIGERICNYTSSQTGLDISEKSESWDKSMDGYV